MRTPKIVGTNMLKQNRTQPN